MTHSRLAIERVGAMPFVGWSRENASLHGRDTGRLDFEGAFGVSVVRRDENISIGEHDQLDENNENGDQDRKKDAEAQVAHFFF